MKTAPRYTDMSGYFTDEILSSDWVRCAKRDPLGARVGLLSYGELVGYPANGCPPIFTHQGEVSWRSNIAAATPLQLGIAWYLVDQKEAKRGTPPYQTPEGQNGHGDEENGTMPQIAYTPSAGAMLEPGFYRAKLSEITEEDGQFGPQLRLQWVILNDDGEPTDKEIRSWASCKWHEKSKLFAVAKALLKSKCPQPPAGIDTDLLLNKKADLEVVAYKKGDGSDGTKIGTIYPFGSMVEDAA
jgi:hypothetical protein